jgi:hypothetical protein
VTATAALRGGLVDTWRRPRLVFGLFALNVLWAVAAAWPCYAQLRAVTGRRPLAEALARGVDFAVLAEILQRRPAVGTAAVAGASVGLLGWVALSWFLTAGILGVLRTPAPGGGLRAFAAAAAARGFVMARLQLLGLLPYGAALVVAAGLAALAAWLGSFATSPWVALWAGVAGTLPGAVLFWWSATALDLARARAALEEEPRAARLLWAALTAVPRRPWRLPLVQLEGALLGLLVTLVYLVVAVPVPFAFAAGIVVLTLLRQVTVLLRIGIRVGVLSATLTLAAASPTVAAAAGDEGALDPRGEGGDGGSGGSRGDAGWASAPVAER